MNDGRVVAAQTETVDPERGGETTASRATPGSDRAWMAALLDPSDDPKRAAVLTASSAMNQHELANGSIELAARIAASVPPGRRVGFVQTGLVDDVAGLLATLLANRSVAMLPVRGPGDPSLVARATAASCGAVLQGTELKMLPGPETTPEDPRDSRFGADASGTSEAVLLYTSGTTGEPTGVRISAANLESNLTAMHRSTMPWRPDDRLGHVLALSHSFGLSMLLLAVARRVPLVLADGTQPSRRLISGLDKHDVSLFACVPYFLRLAAHRGVRLGQDGMRSLRVLYLAGGGVTDDELDELLPAYRGTMYLMYGLTEATARVAVRRRGDGAPPDSVGLPLPGVHVDIVDDEGRPVPTGHVGRIRVASPSLMLGYLGASARRPDGPYTTTDLGRLAPSGDLFVTGRVAEMTNFRGNRVSLSGLEARLCQLPGVGDALVVPEHDGEDSTCIVSLVLAPGADPSAVRRAAIKTVEPRGLVSEVRAVEQIPVTRSGKKLRRSWAPGPDGEGG